MRIHTSMITKCMNTKTYVYIAFILILSLSIIVVFRNRDHGERVTWNEETRRLRDDDNVPKPGNSTVDKKIIEKEINLVDWKTKRSIALTYDLRMNGDQEGVLEIYENRSNDDRHLYYSAILEPYKVVSYRDNKTPSEFLTAKVLSVASDKFRKAVLLEFDLVAGETPNEPVILVFPGSNESLPKRRTHYLFISGPEEQSLSIFPETIWWSIRGLEPVGVSLEEPNSCSLFYKNPKNDEVVQKNLKYDADGGMLTTVDSNGAEVYSKGSDWWANFQFWDRSPFNQAICPRTTNALTNNPDKAERQGYRVVPNHKL